MGSVKAPTPPINFPKTSPKIPAFVTNPEPCNFFDNPALWIQWMEEECEAYKAKKAAEQESKRIRDEEARIAQDKRKEEELNKEREEKDCAQKELNDKKQKIEVTKRLEENI